jgi:hypothetical protein
LLSDQDGEAGKGDLIGGKAGGAVAPIDRPGNEHDGANRGGE